MTSLQKQDQSVQELSSKMDKNFAGLGEKLDSYIGKKHALKKYDQFALNASCFYPSCAISRNFCCKNI